LSQSSGRSLPPISRSTPPPPFIGSTAQPLTAAEEKARLKAQYEAQDARAATSASGAHPDSSHANQSSPVIPSPPPLRPRPPVQYIRETQAEDSWTQSQLFTLDRVASVNGRPPDFGFPQPYSPQSPNGSALPNP